MSPKLPLPIFRPSRYLFPTLSSNPLCDELISPDSLARYYAAPFAPLSRAFAPSRSTHARRSMRILHLRRARAAFRGEDSSLALPLLALSRASAATNGWKRFHTSSRGSERACVRVASRACAESIARARAVGQRSIARGFVRAYVHHPQ